MKPNGVSMVQVGEKAVSYKISVLGCQPVVTKGDLLSQGQMTGCFDRRYRRNERCEEVERMIEGRRKGSKATYNSKLDCGT